MHAHCVLAPQGGPGSSDRASSGVVAVTRFAVDSDRRPNDLALPGPSLESGGRGIARSALSFDFAMLSAAPVLRRVSGFRVVPPVGERAGLVGRYSDSIPCVFRLSMTRTTRFRVSPLQRPSIQRAQSWRVRRSPASTWLRPVSGSTSRKICATPLRTYSCSIRSGWRLHGQMRRLPHFADQLLVGLIHADHRTTGMYVAQKGYECGAAPGRDQYFFR